MDHDAVAVVGVVAACFVFWAVAAGWLTRRGVSAPMVFVLLGLLLTNGPIALVHLDLRSSAVKLVAEVTLAVVLFGDASRINARTFRRDAGLPARLLLVGLPLTILLGAVAAALLLPGATVWVAAAVAAIVAPTDAALGESVMADRRVPAVIRQALNVESGLNDGIATPFVNLFLAGAVSGAAARTAQLSTAAVDLLGGSALGAGIGLGGALLFREVRRRGLLADGATSLGSLGLALVAYAVAVSLGANGFVAAFVAGAAFGTAMGPADEWRGFSEEVGTVMSLTMWFVFGAVMLVPGLEGVTWRHLLFVVAALTVVRIVPVALATAGSGFDRRSVLFIGWFGPRGLASVVFGLIAVDSLTGPPATTLLAAVTLTVALSVVVHGLTAGPGAALYARRPERRAASS